jgi:hypothetical protein
VQPCRGAGEGQLLRHRDEHLKVPQLHRMIISHTDAGKRKSSLA